MQHLKRRKNISGKYQAAPNTELEFIPRFSGFTESNLAWDSHRGEAGRDPLEITSVRPRQVQPLQPCNRLSGPTLHLLQCVPVSLVLGSPGLNTVPQMSLSGAEERGIITRHPPNQASGCSACSWFPQQTILRRLLSLREKSRRRFIFCTSGLGSSISHHLPHDHSAEEAQPSQVDWVSGKVPERLLSA